MAGTRSKAGVKVAEVNIEGRLSELERLVKELSARVGVLEELILPCSGGGRTRWLVPKMLVCRRI